MSSTKMSPAQYLVAGETDGEPVKMTAEQLERLLLAQLEAAEDNPVQAMWQLARFYKAEGQIELAMGHLRSALDRVDDVETKAQVVLALGQTAESCDDFVLAETFYRQVLTLAPERPATRYFARNNLGFSLNQLERFEEGEDFCRQAIEIDSGRSNGHKNLGLALEGQGRYQEAAEAFVAATLANSRDGRSLRHLQAMLEKHPELVDEFASKLDYCEKAVVVARA